MDTLPFLNYTSINVKESPLLLEIFLRNLSFVTLFISMLFYWIQTAFSSKITSGYFSHKEVKDYSNKTITIISPSPFLPSQLAEGPVVVEEEEEEEGPVVVEEEEEGTPRPLLATSFGHPCHSFLRTAKKEGVAQTKGGVRHGRVEGKGGTGSESSLISSLSPCSSLGQTSFSKKQSFESTGGSLAYGPLPLLAYKKTMQLKIYDFYTSCIEKWHGRGRAKKSVFSFSQSPSGRIIKSYAAEPLIQAASPPLEALAVKKNFGTITMIISNFLLFFLLICRWTESGHFPLSNLYESLMFLSWSCTFIHLLLEFKTEKFRPEATLLTPSKSYAFRLIGSITSPCAFFTNAFATFSLPPEMQKVSPLVPALQSNWLMMHVTVMIISYSALILGSLLSIAFLILTSSKSFFFKQLLKMRLNNLAWNFDNYSYRVIGMGFPFLTIGILSGAVWANEAWGSYWSWDPKETWALLTWLIFAIYLHARITKGWQGKKPALIASFGFLAIWVCFLGVNLIGEGLHSYGWFSQNS
uniref:Cytochrome c biogenesis protein CcsA n=1 Tax=Chloromonas radiata TaxID=47907 RepID=A0A0S2ICR2_9CHLO|nr:heme attachment to plastid cytochrome c [Chloromonas radiata]